MDGQRLAECRQLTSESGFSNVRPEASHLGSRQRHSSNVVSDVSVASVAQPRANGDGHQRVAQSRTLEMQTRRNALEFLTREVVRTKPRGAQSTSTVATTRMRQVPRTFEAGTRNKIRAQDLRSGSPLIAEWSSSTGKRHAISLCLDCVKECLKVYKQTSAKRELLCISCASCRIAVQIQP